MEIKIKKLEREEAWEEIFLLKGLLELIEPVKKYKAYRMFYNRLYIKNEDKWRSDKPKTPYHFNCWKVKSWGDKKEFNVRFSKWDKPAVVTEFDINEKSIPGILAGIERKMSLLKDRVDREDGPAIYNIEHALEKVFKKSFTYKKFESYKKTVVGKLMEYAKEIQGLNFDTVEEKSW